MSRQNTLYQIAEWTETVRSEMPQLSKPVAVGLALWSFFIALTRCCSLTVVTEMISAITKKKENTVRQRLREWYFGADKKKGAKRRQLEVATCFAPLLSWILRYWHGSQLILAVDPTTLAGRFTVLSVCVVYRSCAIPVAWKVLLGNRTHAWNPEWKKMFDLLNPAIPPNMQVLVLTDRGLYSPTLFKHIKSLGWCPFMRINFNSTFRPQDQRSPRPLSTFAPRPGTQWSGRGTYSRKNPLECTLLAFWHENADEPWLIVTNLSPEMSDACWYSLRMWIEQCFRTIKSGGLQWQNTHMEDPERAGRIWLAISVAMLWMLNIGTQMEVNQLSDSVEIEIDTPPTPKNKKRRVSVFRKGWFRILVALLCDDFPELQKFIPEDLPRYASYLPIPLLRT